MIFWILRGLVVLSPLPFAAVSPWSWSLMGCVVGALLLAWSATLFRGNAGPAVGLRSTWPYLLLFLLPVGWAALQSSSFMPEGWHHPIWQSAETVLATDAGTSVSLNPFDTQSALLRLLTYGGIFWLSLQYCRDARRARTAFYTLAVAGLVYSAYGVAVEFTGADLILWYEKFAYLDDVTSTFVNRNSFATYAGLTLVCTSGLLLKIMSEAFIGPYGRRERLRRLIEHTMARGWILLLAWITIMTALLLTHSRAGFVTTAIALLILSISLGLTRAVTARYAVAMGAFLALAGVGFFAVSGDVTGERLTRSLIDAGGRMRIYELTQDGIRTAPVLGTGYGTFEEVFRFYRTEDFPVPITKAHNTYLENASELGIPAALALFASIAALFLLTLRGLLRRRRDSVYPCIGFAATALVAAHSLVDFSLQIPAVAATYAFLMGAAAAQSWSSQRSPDHW